MLIFGVSLQLFAYILWAFNVLPAMGLAYPYGNADQMNNLNSIFSLNWYTALIGGTGAVIGVAMLLLRQGTYAIYALLIFAIGVFIQVIGPFFLAIPNTIAALLPSETIPSGLGFSPIAVVIGVMFNFALFFFISELVIQRNLN